MTKAYYNEFEPSAAAWLRELIKAGLIAPGDVDERDIKDVRPDDLRGYTQCHFFAGIGVWSYALRLAGWPDSRPIWTASCPCQPFSTSGKKAGFDDERHLWPDVEWIIRQYREIGSIPVILGEQVASKDANPWFDLVQADLEALGYTFGCVPFPSAGVGAPHIRDRAYWVGYTDQPGLEGHGSRHSPSIGQREGTIRPAAEAGESVWMADSHHAQPQRATGDRTRSRESGWKGSSGRLADCYCDRRGEAGEREPAEECNGIERDSAFSGLGNTDDLGGRGDAGAVPGAQAQAERDLRRESNGAQPTGATGGPGPTNGFWRDSDWLFCRDGKWRPVEPGTFPLAHGAPERVGRLRGYGNAINAEAAKVFIEAVKEILDGEQI